MVQPWLFLTDKILFTKMHIIFNINKQHMLVSVNVLCLPVSYSVIYTCTISYWYVLYLLSRH